MWRGRGEVNSAASGARGAAARPVGHVTALRDRNDPADGPPQSTGSGTRTGPHAQDPGPGLRRGARVIPSRRQPARSARTRRTPSTTSPGVVRPGPPRRRARRIAPLPPPSGDLADPTGAPGPARFQAPAWPDRRSDGADVVQPRQSRPNSARPHTAVPADGPEPAASEVRCPARPFWRTGRRAVGTTQETSAGPGPSGPARRGRSGRPPFAAPPLRSARTGCRDFAPAGRSTVARPIPGVPLALSAQAVSSAPASHPARAGSVR